MTDDLTFFALIDDNNIVINTLVITQENVDTGLWGDPSRMIQYTNYTKGGVYQGADGVAPLRYNTAGIGYTYDPVLDAFIAAKPFPSWSLNTETCQWVPPTPYPSDEKLYTWDEETQSWIEQTLGG